MSRRVPVAIRLARNSGINPSTGCLEWNGEINIQNKYGMLRVDGVQKTVHRLAWIEVYGPIPDGKWVLHKCDNRKCLNVDHLYLGTVVENARDFVERGTHWTKTRPEDVKHGSGHGSAVLNEIKVLAIRNQYAAGSVTMQMLATHYDISLKSICNILQGKSWTHVAGPLIQLPQVGTRGKGRTKFDRLTRESIAAFHRESGFSATQIGRWFGVGRATIRNILRECRS
jgi:hypothetical protein